MTLPTTPPLTDLAAVNLELDRPEDQSDPVVARVVAAVNALVPRWLIPPPEGQPWPADRQFGAALLAARIYRRKDNPGGGATFGLEAGPAVVSSGNWPDIAMLLGLGGYGSVGRVG